MRKVVFVLSVIGLLAGLAAAYVSGIVQPTLPPAFAPPINPISAGHLCRGHSRKRADQRSKHQCLPRSSGDREQDLVSEGQEVKKGKSLLVIDDSIQRATVEQLNLRRRRLHPVCGAEGAAPEGNPGRDEAQVVAAEARQDRSGRAARNRRPPTS